MWEPDEESRGHFSRRSLGEQPRDRLDHVRDSAPRSMAGMRVLEEGKQAPGQRGLGATGGSLTLVLQAVGSH